MVEDYSELAINSISAVTKVTTINTNIIVDDVFFLILLIK